MNLKAINIAVATHVMGWTPIVSAMQPRGETEPRYLKTKYGEMSISHFQPSVSISAAWRVVEKLGMRHIALDHWADSDSWQCDIGGHLTIPPLRPYYMPQDLWQATAALAICLAALQALGVEIPE